jgi:hypothetical protein
MFFTDGITREMREFPGYKFTIMGLLDAGAGLLMTFGGTHTSGPMQLLLSQVCVISTTLNEIQCGLVECSSSLLASRLLFHLPCSSQCL